MHPDRQAYTICFRQGLTFTSNPGPASHHTGFHSDDSPRIATMNKRQSERGTLGSSIRLRDLADAVNRSGDRNGLRLWLPTFQRDAIWDPERIEVLWDSLFRGFPVGSLLFIPYGGIEGSDESSDSSTGEKARLVGSDPGKGAGAATDVPRRGDYFLIDGQQRSLAIALGFRRYAVDNGDRLRLWLNLRKAGRPRSSRDVRFDFRVTSTSHPWGAHSTLPQRRRAEELAGAPSATGPSDHPDLERTWPAGPAGKVFPIPVSELLRAAQQQEPLTWERVVRMAPMGLRDQLPDLDDGGLLRLADLHHASQGALTQEIPVQVIGKRASLSPEHLHLLFQRLNVQGVSMTSEELFFSGLKLHWPDAYSLVWDIYEDEQTGRFLKPTKIVHAATRLAIRRLTRKGKNDAYGGRDIPALNLKRFKRLLDESGNLSHGFLTELETSLRDDALPEHGLQPQLRQARRLLEYRSDHSDDPGFPRPLLARLNWRIWHTLVVWLDAGGNPSDDPEDESRAEILRYAAMQHFFARSSRSQKVTTVPADLVCEFTDRFPGKNIYEGFQDAGRSWLDPERILSPGEYEALIYGITDDSMAGGLLRREKDLLLWTQRRWVSAWFPDYDPTQPDRARDLPYDFDHIVPLSSFDRRSVQVDPAVKEEFLTTKDRVGTGIGNLRVWPKSANRSDSDKSLADKRLLEEGDKPLDKDLAAALELQTHGELRRASLIPDENLELWRAADRGRGGPREWDPPRVEAFRKAALARRASIYRMFFEGLDFAEWP